MLATDRLYRLVNATSWPNDAIPAKPAYGDGPGAKNSQLALYGITVPYKDQGKCYCWTDDPTGGYAYAWDLFDDAGRTVHLRQQVRADTHACISMMGGLEVGGGMGPACCRRLCPPTVAHEATGGWVAPPQVRWSCTDTIVKDWQDKKIYNGAMSAIATYPRQWDRNA